MQEKLRNLILFEDYGSENRNTGNLSGIKKFTDSEVKYYQRLWDFLPFKYRGNKFFSDLWGKVLGKNSLTKRQWLELEYLLKNGKSRYGSGQIPSNY